MRLYSLLFYALFSTRVLLGEPGRVYLVGNEEVYVPDSVLMIHGVDSNITSFREAIPSISGLFGEHEARKYAFQDLKDSAEPGGSRYFPDPSAVDNPSKAVRFHPLMNGYDYRFFTGTRSVSGAAKAPPITDLPNIDSLSGKNLGELIQDQTGVAASELDSPYAGFTPIDGQQSLVVIAHSMGGLVTRAWMAQSRKDNIPKIKRCSGHETLSGLT